MAAAPPRVFLGNAPWSKPGFYGVRAGSRWPHFERETERYMPFPFYLAYTAAILEKENIPCLLVDGIAERITESEFLERLTAFKPEVIILEVSTSSMETDLRVARQVKERRPDSTPQFRYFQRFRQISVNARFEYRSPAGLGSAAAGHD